MGENVMESYEFLLSLAIILLSTKVFGLITEKVHLPQVVGAILAGVILGPSCFGILEQSDFLIKASEIGVIMLMFIAGLDTDLQEIKKTGPAACLIAVLGVFVPIIMCSGVYWLFFADRWDFTTVIRAVFVGVVFAATSVSITVETLNEMGKLKSRVGTTLLSAAITEDIPEYLCKRVAYGHSLFFSLLSRFYMYYSMKRIFRRLRQIYRLGINGVISSQASTGILTELFIKRQAVSVLRLQHRIGCHSGNSCTEKNYCSYPENVFCCLFHTILFIHLIVNILLSFNIYDVKITTKIILLFSLSLFFVLF